jgi:hypothetical protein
MSKVGQGDILKLRENVKIFPSWFEVFLFSLPPALILFMLLTRFYDWGFWSAVTAFFVCDLVFGFFLKSIKIVSVELQRKEDLNLVTQTLVVGRMMCQTKYIGTSWTWVRVRQHYNKGIFYLVELGSSAYQCKTLLIFSGSSKKENVDKANEIASKVARFLNIENKGFVGVA